MSTHRRHPPRRRADPPRRGARRATVRRTGRGALLGFALTLTVVTGVSGLNLLSAGAAGPSADPAASVEVVGSTADRVASAADGAAASTPAPEPSTAPDRATEKSRPDKKKPASLPKDSGSGRRVVFDISAQRVWLVGGGDKVQRTYLASGSIHDNLDPGSYEVYSRSRNATSYDYSSTMEYFVRFTRGDNAAIGFHQIPVTSDGDPVQTHKELGTPTSSGCIRQRPADAEALWDFAPVGTPVVVTA